MVARSLFGATAILRIIIPPLIFYSPVTITALSVFLDTIDAEFASHHILSKGQYQLYDKTLDFWWYVFAVIFSYYRFPDYRILLIVLFLYRLFGQIVFYITRERVALVVFANFFENVFLAILAGTYITGLSFLLSPRIIGFTLGGAFIAKLFQEWFLHYAKLSIREDFLKMKRKWVKD